MRPAVRSLFVSVLLIGIAAVAFRYFAAVTSETAEEPTAAAVQAGPANNGSAFSSASDAGTGAEAQLRRVLHHVEARKMDAALGELELLISRYPNFRLAHLVRGDLLLARSGPIEGLGNTGHAAQERLEELRAEAIARLRANRDPPSPDLVPRYLLQLSPAQAHAIVVDARRSRVYVYQNMGGVPRLVEDYYTSLGKGGVEKAREGDQKTPLGVYHITSQIPGTKLPDLYGWGAFPLDYPNEWDRLRGRTGYGIWLHGVPRENYARAPQASDGCIALANPEIAQLATRVQVGFTPVVISGDVEWVTPAAWRSQREQFMQHLETWRGDWESLETERYLAHYARSFRSADMSLAAWQAHKRRVNSGRKWIKVRLGDVSVLRVPGREDVLQVTFDQDYRSDRFSQRTRKRQYWVIGDGKWEIAYESPVGRAPARLPESFPATR
jgi:murein L,D-transpeptidase YafK